MRWGLVKSWSRRVFMNKLWVKWAGAGGVLAHGYKVPALRKVCRVEETIKSSQRVTCWDRDPGRVQGPQRRLPVQDGASFQRNRSLRVTGRGHGTRGRGKQEQKQRRGQPGKFWDAAATMREPGVGADGWLLPRSTVPQGENGHDHQTQAWQVCFPNTNDITLHRTSNAWQC